MDTTRVFISWSGAGALAVARVWFDLLNDVFDDSVEPFISDEIDAGARSLDEIRQALEGARFAIAIVTRGNQSAPWLNFEVGAVANQLRAETGESTRVAPFLVDFERESEVVGPITQFQMKKFGHDGVEQIVASLASVLGASKQTHLKRFEMLWSDEYEDSFEGARKKVEELSSGTAKAAPEREADDVLDEILAVVRDLRVSAVSPPSANHKRNAREANLARSQSYSRVIEQWGKSFHLAATSNVFTTSNGSAEIAIEVSRVPDRTMIEMLSADLNDTAKKNGVPTPRFSISVPSD